MVCRPPGWLLSPWNFPGKNTVVWYHFLLQKFFPIQESNSCVLHYRQILYHWATWEAPYSMYMLVYRWQVVHMTSVNEMLLKNLKKNTLFRAVLGLQQNSEEDTEISHMLLCMHNLSPYQYHSPEWCLFFLLYYTHTHTHTHTHTPRMNLHWHIISQSLWFTHLL